VRYGSGVPTGVERGLIYRIEPEAVLILTIAHGARDLEALWERRQQSGEVS